jgi:hypothetical protein
VGSVYCTLLRAGIISRSALNAKKKFDTVWAWTPWDKGKKLK